MTSPAECMVWGIFIICVFASCQIDSYKELRKDEIQLQLKQEETKRLEIVKGAMK